jgi:3-oxoacyl-[acyl-carrier protein] reductase
MEPGISGLRALVCGASRGLGFACAAALAAEVARVTLAARNRKSLVRAAARIAETGAANVNTIAADVSTPAGREELLAPSAPPDILVTNAGGPASTDFRALTPADWQAADRSWRPLLHSRR